MSDTSTRIARRYARALFDSYEPAEVEGVRDSLLSIARVWGTSAELRATIQNPALPTNARQDVLRDVSRAVRPGDEKFVNFVSILAENRRIQALPQIAEAFAALVDLLRKVLALEITGAFNISETEQHAIQEQLQRSFGSLVSVAWATNRDLIGGLMVKSGDRLIDNSVRGALERIRQDLVL